MTMETRRSEEISAWFDQPLSQQFFAWLKAEMSMYEVSQCDAYVPGEPQATQEILCDLRGRINVLGNLTALADEQASWSEVFGDE